MAETKIKPVADERARALSASGNPSQEVVTVLICSNAMRRIGIKHLLAMTSFAVSETVFNQTSRAVCCPDTTPALFVVDASAPSDEMVDTIRYLKTQYPEARIVVMADHFDLSFVRLGHDAGVDGFCLTASSRDVLIKSLELAMLGQIVLPSTLVRLMLGAMSVSLKPQSEDNKAVVERKFTEPRARNLSPREAEILGCIMGGAPNKVIARQLEVTEATVKVHVKAILRKLGAANRTQAAMWATTHLPTNGRDSLNA
jgi:two-component system, NarL family, nitrate/nitrite response regulator NarL